MFDLTVLRMHNVNTFGCGRLASCAAERASCGDVHAKGPGEVC